MTWTQALAPAQVTPIGTILYLLTENGLKAHGIARPKTAAAIDALSGVGVAEENL